MSKLNILNKTVAVSAHNGLCAKLVEKVGFDAIWASGFEISATYGLTDSGILTLTEMVRIVRQMSEHTKLPIIVDCDEGYGGLHNIRRTAIKMKQAGASAICIEDNKFPKRHSFWAKGQKLISKEQHGNKVKLIKDINNNLLVVARTEALIRGLGIEEALRRVTYYDKCGADIILIHSRDKTGKEVKEIVKHWTSKTPLMTIPTKYPFMTTTELFNIGYNIVVWANHTLRLSLKAIEEGLKELKEKENAKDIEDRLGSLEGIYSLTGMEEMERIDKKYGGVK